MATSKVCTKCKLPKPIGEFRPVKNKSGSQHSHCNNCRAAAQAIYRDTEAGLASRRKWYKAKGAATRRKWKFGLSDEQLQSLLADTTHCDICGRVFTGKEPNIDHCHSTNHIRGLLCVPCNSLLGYVNDNPATLAKAIEYVMQAGLVPAHRIVPAKEPHHGS